MGKTKIEWCDFSINPVKGLCPMDCKDNQGKSYCYARRMYKRFHWDEEIHYEPIVFQDLMNKSPSKIFIGSTMELFGDWVEPLFLKDIFMLTQIGSLKQHTFIFLTKQPQNLIKYSPFPDNCWVGVSVPKPQEFGTAIYYLEKIHATVKFLSIEPLLEKFGYDENRMANYLQLADISWVIIGQQTPSSIKTQPKVEWIKEIVDACDKSGVPVFLKDNLNHLFAENNCELFTKYKTDLFKLVEESEERKDGCYTKEKHYHLRQEFPQVEVKV